VSSLKSSASNSDDRQQLSDLIGLIYDAVIDPSLWLAAVERAVYFVGGAGGGLFCKDVGAMHANTLYHFGFERAPPIALFQKIYYAAEGHFLGDIEQPVATTDLMPLDELAASEIYCQWAQPRDLVDFVSALLDKTSFSATIFGVYRHKRNGLVDDAARRQMRLIAPHIRRAVLISRMFEFEAGQAATFADTFDGLSAGMFLVESDGRLIHANAAGQAILDIGDILRETGGRLVACNAEAHQTLRGVFAAAGEGDAALGIQGIAVPLTGKNDERYVAHTLPLTSGARRRAGIISTAAAALFIRKTSLGTSSSRFEVIGKAFKLTPTELRVLLAVVEVGGVPEVAAALGIAGGTVKTHLGRVFEKTGATRQADLVKLVAGYSTPL
jgi:DNA-binding CsgD family transcriptional regulator/PAS domain-containing protein